MLELTTLGAPELRRADGVSVATLLAQPKRFALVVYLRVAARDGYVQRDALLALFWPDSPETRARAALRQALQFLRRALGADVVRTRGDDEVGLDAVRLRCDVDALHAALADNDAATALALMGAGFLPGVHVDDAPSVTDWIDETRRALHQAVLDCTVRCVDRELAAARVPAALALLRGAATLDAVHEPLHQRLLRALDANGDRAGALAEHERFTRRLRETLDVNPSPETEALVASIVARERPRTTSEPTPEPSSAPTPGPTPSPSPAAPSSSIPPSATTPHRDSRPARHRTITVALLAVIAIALAPLAWYALRTDGDSSSAATASATADTPRILVVPLENGTGVDSLDPLGRMAADWITEGLSRIDGIEVVPGTAVLTVERALADSQQADGSAARRARLQQELGATAIVSGAYYRTGATLHLQARVHDARTARLIRPATTVSVPIDSAMRGVDALRRTLIAGFAPMLDTATHFRRSMAPPSFEAYRDLVTGFEAFVAGDVVAAAAAWEQSLTVDSAYPMARLALTIAYLNLDEPENAWRSLQSLTPRRASFGPVEQATFDMIDGIMRGDLRRARAAVARSARTTPGSINDFMIGELDRRLGRPEAAVEHLRALGPERGELRGWRPYWRELIWSLLMTGDARGALVESRRARALYADDATFAEAEVRALAALGLLDSLQLLLDSTAAQPGPLAAGTGARFRLAAELIDPVADSAVRARWLARSARWYDAERRTGRALPDGLRLGLAATWIAQGRTTDATALLLPMAERSDAPWRVWRLLGVAAARAGDDADAMRWQRRIAAFADSLPAARIGIDAPVLLFAQAQIAAQRNRLDEAAALLRTAIDRGLSLGPDVTDDVWLRPLRISDRNGS